ncbi:Pectin lyase-like superfamily protein [Zea mays]|uniref:Exopolygalacturonase n=1 Tax=Zea mays TaxID=4577 RepID=A0A1D6Q047_MAIZE|nr:Pectin lyase-like superfamily protein [Zea mays]
MEARPRLLLVAAVAVFVSVSAAAGAAVVINVKNYGAHGNGVNDDTKPLMAAWKAACGSAGAVTMVVAPGTYYIGPGTLKAATDLKRFGNDWIEFGWVNGLTVAGGVIDGQGAASWPFNKCPIRKDCKVLPTSVLFVNSQNTVVRDVTSVNPKFFHMALLSVKNVRMSGLRIRAPPNSPNTDGIHIERSSGVSIVDTHIGTGDDCISVGQGNDNVEVSRVQCGPGHGMSVGSLGRYSGEGDVTRVHVRDMTFTGTTNGVRIKTWENSPSRSNAAHMVFENMVMKDVQNPIIIDQKYCPYYNCEHKYVSGVTLKDIHFRNIKGTATTPVAVLLRCGVPCQGLVLQDVDLRYKGQGATSAKCENAKAKYVGYQFPKPCSP